MEQKQQQKKQWHTPELIILVRSKPEEAVLTCCKNFGMSNEGAYNLGCYVNACVECSAQVAS